MRACIYFLDPHVNLNIINFVLSDTCVKKGINQFFIQSTFFIAYVKPNQSRWCDVKKNRSFLVLNTKEFFIMSATSKNNFSI